MDAPATIKVLTYNVWNDLTVDIALRAKLIAETIQLCDVCLLQECTPQLLVLLKPKISEFKYHTPESTNPYFTMVFSKQELKFVNRIPFPTSTQNRDFLSCFTRVSGQLVFLATSHLESLGSGSLERGSCFLLLSLLSLLSVF
jgi:endonuclease/exonuclease/phosphatase family metal-dependent hydrolase